MDVEPLRQQIGGGLVVRLVRHREHRSGGPGHSFMPAHQDGDHFFRAGNTFGLIDGGELAKLGIGAGRGKTQGADTLGDRIDRVPQLRVLQHEHVVQRVEHRAGHVPVEIVRGEVQRVGIRE